MILTLGLKFNNLIRRSYLMLMVLNRFCTSTFKSLFWVSFPPLFMNIFHHCSICFVFLFKTLRRCCMSLVCLPCFFVFRITICYGLSCILPHKMIYENPNSPFPRNMTLLENRIVADVIS